MYYVKLLLLAVLPLFFASCGDDEKEYYHRVLPQEVVGQTFKTVSLNGNRLSKTEYSFQSVAGDESKLILNVSGTEIPKKYKFSNIEVTAKEVGLGLNVSTEYNVDTPYTDEETKKEKILRYTYTIDGTCSNIGDGKLYFDLILNVTESIINPES